MHCLRFGPHYSVLRVVTRDQIEDAFKVLCQLSYTLVLTKATGLEPATTLLTGEELVFCASGHTLKL